MSDSEKTVSTVAIAEALASLEDDDGRLDPREVVETARDEDSVLHPLFEWDDSEAAEKYRLGQARELIRRVKVRVEPVREVYFTIPKYLRDPEAPANVARYVSTTVLRNEEDNARAAACAEFERAAGALRRARDILRAFGEIELTDQLLSLIANARATIQDRPHGSA